MKNEIKRKIANDPEWEEVKKLSGKGKFTDANKLIGKIYKKYGEKYN